MWQGVGWNRVAACGVAAEWLDQLVPAAHASVAGAGVRGQPAVICFLSVFFFRGSGCDCRVSISWVAACGRFRLIAISPSDGCRRSRPLQVRSFECSSTASVLVGSYVRSPSR